MMMKIFVFRSARTSKNTFVSLSVTPSVSTIVRLLALVFQYWGLELSCFKIQKSFIFAINFAKGGGGGWRELFAIENCLSASTSFFASSTASTRLWHQLAPTKSPNTKYYIAINFAKSCLAASTSTSLRLDQLLSHLHHRLH